jgi:hypothetical protein
VAEVEDPKYRTEDPVPTILSLVRSVAQTGSHTFDQPMPPPDRSQRFFSRLTMIISSPVLVILGTALTNVVFSVIPCPIFNGFVGVQVMSPPAYIRLVNGARGFTILSEPLGPRPLSKAEGVKYVGWYPAGTGAPPGGGWTMINWPGYRSGRFIVWDSR